MTEVLEWRVRISSACVKIFYYLPAAFLVTFLFSNQHRVTRDISPLVSSWKAINVFQHFSKKKKKKIHISYPVFHSTLFKHVKTGLKGTRGGEKERKMIEDRKRYHIHILFRTKHSWKIFFCEFFPSIQVSKYNSPNFVPPFTLAPSLQRLLKRPKEYSLIEYSDFSLQSALSSSKTLHPPSS